MVDLQYRIRTVTEVPGLNQVLSSGGAVELRPIRIASGEVRVMIGGAVRFDPSGGGSRVVGLHRIFLVLDPVIEEDLLEGGGVGGVQYHPVIVEGL